MERDSIWYETGERLAEGRERSVDGCDLYVIRLRRKAEGGSCLSHAWSAWKCFTFSADNWFVVVTRTNDADHISDDWVIAFQYYWDKWWSEKKTKSPKSESRLILLVFKNSIQL